MQKQINLEMAAVSEIKIDPSDSQLQYEIEYAKKYVQKLPKSEIPSRESIERLKVSPKP